MQRPGWDDVDLGRWLLFAGRGNSRLGSETATAHAGVHHLAIAASVPFCIDWKRVHRL